MSKDDDEPNSKNVFVDDTMSSDINTKYSVFKRSLENAKENKGKLSDTIYKDFIPTANVKNADFVLSQINQNVSLLESSKILQTPSKLNSQLLKEATSTFLSFTDLNDHISDIQIKSPENSEFEWGNNTQIAEIADTIDSLTSNVNCKDVCKDILDENMTLTASFDEIQARGSEVKTSFKNVPTSPIIQSQCLKSVTNECFDFGIKSKRKHTQLENCENRTDFSTNDENKKIFDLKLPFIGFTTGNNKKIKISNDALCKASTMFDDFNLGSIDKSPKIKSDNTNKIINDNADVICVNVGGSTEKTKENYCGFMTGNNKKIMISKNALNKAKNIFTDFDIKKDNENILDETETKNMLSQENKDVKTDLCIKNSLLTSSEETAFCFVTGNNKKINVSEKALNQAKSLVAASELDLKNKGFTKQHIDNVHNNNNKIYKNIEDILDTEEAEVTLRFLNENDNNFTVLESVFSKPKYLSAGSDIKTKELKENSNDRMSFGFVTGNNKKITISDEALNKAKIFFDGVDSNLKEENNSNSNENTIIINNNSDEFPKAIECSKDQKAIATFVGFTTGNNKKITISEDSLRKSRTIFDDFNSHTTNLISSKKPTTSFSFCTGSNKKIPISEDALKKARNVFVDFDLEIRDTKKTEEYKNTTRNDDNVKGNNTIPFNFVTGNNKKICVSENALNKTKSVFCDFDFEITDKIETSLLSIESSAFTTGNNKKIGVSKDSLNKAKTIFTDINVKNQEMFTSIKDSVNFTNDKTSMTGVNKKIKLSHEVIHKSEMLLSNMELPIAEKKNQNFSEDTKHNVLSLRMLSTNVCMNYPEWLPKSEKKTKLISTDVLETVNHTLKVNKEHSEYGEIPSSPTSPILQSKKILRKKQNFKVPFKKENFSSQKLTNIDNISTDSCNFSQMFEFSELSTRKCLDNLGNGKQSKSSNSKTLKDLYVDISIKEKPEIEEEILTVSPQNFQDFVFKHSRNDINIKPDESMCVIDLEKIFMEHKNIDRKIIPDGWVHNHIKWIIWKLASYERTFKNILDGEFILTVSNVLKQLKYRYDRELYNSERPILRKILETDEIPSKRMVLCVSNIKLNTNIENENDSRTHNSKYELDLTDGWYEVTTVIDPFLSTMIDKKRIVIGTKLIISGAELLNCSQGISPLEEKGDIRLKIWGNNCRRCAPWLKLGLYKNCKKPINFKLKTCKPGNGPIPVLRIVPLNIYPTLFLNKLSDGTVVMNSEKIQQIENAKKEAELQNKIDQLYEKVKKEFYEEEFKGTTQKTKAIKRKFSDSPEELINMYESSGDPSGFLNNLPVNQRNIMQQYIVEKEVKVRQNIDDRVRKLYNDLALDKDQPVKVLKARILSLDSSDLTSAILTVWKPTEAMLDFFKEGVILDVTNVTPTGIRSKELHLSIGKRSVFSEVAYDRFSTKCSELSSLTNKCTEFGEMYLPNFSPKYNEVNMVGIVVDLIPNILDDNNGKSGKMQTLYLANEDVILIAVNFWGGVKKYGFNKIIEKGAHVACTNLQYRSKSLVKRVRQLYVTEFTNFTQYPKKTYLSSALQNLKTSISHKKSDDFMERCSRKLQSVTSFMKVNLCEKQIDASNKNIIDELRDVSSIDFNSSLSENIHNVDERLKNNDSFNHSKSLLNRSSILSENTINANQNLSLAEMKINKLKSYGEPPPLAPIVMKNSPLVNKSFSTPLRNEKILDRSVNETENEKMCKEIIIEESDFSPPLSLE